MAAFIALSALPTLVAVLRFQPDLLLVFFGYPTGVVAWGIHQLTGLPYVLALRGADVPGFAEPQVQALHRWLHPLTRRIWGNAATVTANSQGLARLARSSIPEVAVEVIPNGVDLSIFSPPPQREPNPVLKLVYVGRFAPQKRVLDLVEAMLILRRTSPEPFELVLAGDGPERSAIEKAVRAGHLEDSVHLLGWVPFEQVPAVYRTADLYVHTAGAEGMASTMLQAMASALPIVTTNVEGVEELVTDGINGRVVPIGDMAGFAVAIQDLAKDREKRLRMGKASAARAGHYTWQGVARRYQAIFEQVMQGTAPIRDR